MRISQGDNIYMLVSLKERLIRKATMVAARNRTIRNIIEKNRISLDFPSNLFIEPTNLCNLKCRMCPQNDNENVERGFMDMETYRKVIDESLRNGKRTAIFFHKDGEPLLHDGLFEMIEYAVSKKAAYRTHLSTNAHLLNEERIKKTHIKYFINRLIFNYLLYNLLCHKF